MAAMMVIEVEVWMAAMMVIEVDGGNDGHRSEAGTWNSRLCTHHVFAVLVNPWQRSVQMCMYHTPKCSRGVICYTQVI